MGTFEPAPRCWHPVIAASYAYWRRVAPKGRLPGRQHLDPSEIPRLLPYLWLMDVQHAPRCYRWRLIGSLAQTGSLVLRRGDPLEGRLEADRLEQALAVLDAVVETRRPSWTKGQPILPHDPAVKSVERLVLPLARDGTVVDMLLGAVVCEWVGGRRP